MRAGGEKNEGEEEMPRLWRWHWWPVQWGRGRRRDPGRGEKRRSELREAKLRGL